MVGGQIQQHQQQPQVQAQQQKQQPDFDLSKEFMTIKEQLLVLVNRLEHVEKELMMRK